MSLSGSAKLWQIAKETCRDLRKRQTAIEEVFWNVVRNRKFHGKKFYRQYAILVDLDGRETFFVADFFCFEEHLVIEIDGKSHEAREDYDRLRTAAINDLGMRVVRIKNREIEEDLAGVLTRLGEMLTHPNPSLAKRGERGVSSDKLP